MQDDERVINLVLVSDSDSDGGERLCGICGESFNIDVEGGITWDFELGEPICPWCQPGWESEREGGTATESD